jgi:hypothetical protein
MEKMAGFLVMLALATGAAGQTPQVELVPTLGYSWGGQILVQERAFQFKDLDVDLSSSGSYGLRLDIPLGQALALELLVHRQETQLKDDQALFGETPGGFVEPGSKHILDLQLNTAQLGFLWFLKNGPTRWHVGAALGITHVNFLLPIPSDTVMSYSLAAGLQMELSQHLAVRFEGRFFAANTDENLRSTYAFANPDCRAPCSYTFAYKDWLRQTWLTTGLAIRF